MSIEIMPGADGKMTRPVDEMGRVVLPKETREKLGLFHNCPVEISTDGNIITVKRFEKACVFCGAIKNLKLFKGKYICPGCLKV